MFTFWQTWQLDKTEIRNYSCAHGGVGLVQISQDAHVIAVSKSNTHSFSKATCTSISLIEGLGVEGDAHLGKTVKHRSRVVIDPSQPNLRQVHLMHGELHDELIEQGFRVAPGIMGENITTRGIDILGLPRDALLLIGDTVVIKITGLRNPCKQLDDYQNGLLSAVLDKTTEGELIRKAGVMGVVTSGGTVKTYDAIKIQLPDEPYHKLERV